MIISIIPQDSLQWEIVSIALCVSPSISQIDELEDWAEKPRFTPAALPYEQG